MGCVCLQPCCRPSHSVFLLHGGSIAEASGGHMMMSSGMVLLLMSGCEVMLKAAWLHHCLLHDLFREGQAAADENGAVQASAGVETWLLWSVQKGMPAAAAHAFKR